MLSDQNFISNYILKEFKDQLKARLIIIIMSFILGEIPKQSKTCHLTPLFKKLNWLDSSNYRPNYLLFSIGKIFE